MGGSLRIKNYKLKIKNENAHSFLHSTLGAISALERQTYKK
jgi:hypothetical protein